MCKCKNYWNKEIILKKLATSLLILHHVIETKRQTLSFYVCLCVCVCVRVCMFGCVCVCVYTPECYNEHNFTFLVNSKWKWGQSKRSDIKLHLKQTKSYRVNCWEETNGGNLHRFSGVIRLFHRRVPSSEWGIFPDCEIA